VWLRCITPQLEAVGARREPVGFCVVLQKARTRRWLEVCSASTTAPPLDGRTRVLIMSENDNWIRCISNHALPLRGESTDLDPLLELAADSDIVLIGEATHGTHEFYALRAQLTRRLLSEHGFAAVAAESDWPDSYRVNRFVRGSSADKTAHQALTDFRRFPSWMWRNRDVLEFVDWLREYNQRRLKARQETVGFYGLDLYSLHGSVAAVLEYLDGVDPELAQRARERYGCFEQFDREPQAYGYAARLGLSPACEDAVVSQLRELQSRRTAIIQRDGLSAEDEFFHAEQNARVIKNAEEYYRAMFGNQVQSWNLRDTHMADTLDALLEHLRLRIDRPRVVVWAHNSHVGDARATELMREGELNLGQLARERYPNRTCLIGFSTYAGSVAAASRWGGNVERKLMRPALPASHEALFHRVNAPNFILQTRDLQGSEALLEPRLQRAIGVIYRPETERRSHYYRVELTRQFDAMIHVDRTTAVEPLERSSTWVRDEAPETFPSGL